MPKWRSVSFVPGVTLNIEDSTSLDKAKSFRNFCRLVTETESNMKWFITFNVLEKRIIIPIQFKWNWRSNNVGAFFGHQGSDLAWPQFLSALSIVTNWSGEQLTPGQKRVSTITYFNLITWVGNWLLVEPLELYFCLHITHSQLSYGGWEYSLSHFMRRHLSDISPLCSVFITLNSLGIKIVGMLVVLWRDCL